MLGPRVLHCADDRDLLGGQLDAKRFNWLSLHDQDTTHLTSVLQLVKRLPVRLAQPVHRENKWFRGRMGYDLRVGCARHDQVICLAQRMSNFQRQSGTRPATTFHLTFAQYPQFPGHGRSTSTAVSARGVPAISWGSQIPAPLPIWFRDKPSMSLSQTRRK